MLRHSVLWRLRDTTTPQQRLEMLWGLAFLGTECRSVSFGDYGDDLFGGTSGTAGPPMWRRDRRTPWSSFDAALHLDFEEWQGFDEYVADPVHTAASRFNEAASWDELTARVDWYYDGPPPTRRGHVKHVAMFAWAGEADEAALDAVRGLAGVPEVEAVAVGTNSGVHPSDYDWIADIELADRAAAERFLASDPYAAAMETVAAATHYEWTARVTHVMRGR